MEVVDNTLFRQEDFSLNLLFYCKQLQHLRDTQREVAQEAERVAAITMEPRADKSKIEEQEESSSSSYDGDLSEQDDAPLLGGESMAFNKATQVKPKVNVLGECLRCAERKLKIRALQKQNGRLFSRGEKWKEAARRIKVRVSFK